ncbi:hypothetical protein MTO96_013067 [Rhipicephalus appendiculatus]
MPLINVAMMLLALGTVVVRADGARVYGGGQEGRRGSGRRPRGWQPCFWRLRGTGRHGEGSLDAPGRGAREHGAAGQDAAAQFDAAARRLPARTTASVRSHAAFRSTTTTS